MKGFLIPINYIDSWELAKKAFSFLGRNKDLNLIPLLNLASILVFLTCLVGTFSDVGFFSNKILYSVFSMTLYFSLCFIVIYCNTALIAVVLKRLNHEAVPLRYGFGIANQRLLSILKWSLIVSTLGLIAKLLEETQHFFEKCIGTSLGFTWSVASYFVLPFLIVENVSPLQAIQRSKKTVGNGFKNTISITSLAVIVLIVILLSLTEFMIQSPQAIFQMLLWLTPLFLIGYVLILTLEAILICALYINHAQAKQPKDFDRTLLNRAFIKED